MKKALAFAFGLVLVANMAAASNTGFKLNYELIVPATGLSGQNWVSPPYFFFPDGDVGNLDQSPVDWCTDLNNGDPMANTPVQDDLQANYPTAFLTCSGEAVGLPDGQMGNSEVGHLNLGAGRIVYQENPQSQSDVGSLSCRP